MKKFFSIFFLLCLVVPLLLAGEGKSSCSNNDSGVTSCSEDGGGHRHRHHQQQQQQNNFNFQNGNNDPNWSFQGNGEGVVEEVVAQNYQQSNDNDHNSSANQKPLVTCEFNCDQTWNGTSVLFSGCQCNPSTSLVRFTVHGDQCPPTLVSQATPAMLRKAYCICTVFKSESCKCPNWHELIAKQVQTKEKAHRIRQGARTAKMNRLISEIQSLIAPTNHPDPQKRKEAAALQLQAKQMARMAKVDEQNFEESLKEMIAKETAKYEAAAEQVKNCEDLFHLN